MRLALENSNQVHTIEPSLDHGSRISVCHVLSSSTSNENVMVAMRRTYSDSPMPSLTLNALQGSKSSSKRRYTKPIASKVGSTWLHQYEPPKAFPSRLVLVNKGTSLTGIDMDVPSSAVRPDSKSGIFIRQF